MTTDLINRLRTVIAIPVTPFDAAGHVDERALRTVLIHMLSAGVDVFTPNGNTGEFYSLAADDTTRVLAATVDAVGPDALVVAGVGHDVATAAQMARRAADAGVGAVMVHQPPHPYKSADGWIDYHLAITDAAPGVGLVVYLRDPHIGPEVIAALAQRCPALVAVKYAVPDVFAQVAAIDAVGAERVAWVCGLAEKWAPFMWLAGARGFTSGLVNVAPGLSLRLLELLRAGQLADAMSLWRSLAPMEQLRARRFDANNVSALKEALAQRTLCTRMVRPPISELPDDERELVRAILAEWDALS
jgi:4-hydroxy-tetrahydrodipicolinate synthase